MIEKQQISQKVKIRQVPTPSQKVQSSLNFLEHRKKQILTHHQSGITLKNIQQRANSRSNNKSINKQISNKESKLDNSQLKKINQKKLNYTEQQNNMKRSFLRHSRKNSESSSYSRQSSKRNLKSSKKNSLLKLQFLLNKQNKQNNLNGNILRKSSQKQLNYSRTSSIKSFKSISEASSLAQSRAVLLNSITEKLLQSKHNTIAVEPIINNNKKSYLRQGQKRNQQKGQNTIQNSYQPRDIFDRLQKLQNLIVQMGKFQPKMAKQNLIESSTKKEFKARQQKNQGKTDQSFQMMLKQIKKLKEQVKQIKSSKQGHNFNVKNKWLQNKSNVNQPIKRQITTYYNLNQGKQYDNIIYLNAYPNNNSSTHYRDLNNQINNNYLKFSSDLNNNQNYTKASERIARQNLSLQNTTKKQNVHVSPNYLNYIEPSSGSYQTTNNSIYKYAPNVYQSSNSFINKNQKALHSQRNPYHYIGPSEFQRQLKQERTNNVHKINLSQKPKINITFGVNNIKKNYREEDRKILNCDQQSNRKKYINQPFNNVRQDNGNKTNSVRQEMGNKTGTNTNYFDDNNYNYIDSVYNNANGNILRKQNNSLQNLNSISKRNLHFNQSQNHLNNNGKISLSKKKLN